MAHATTEDRGFECSYDTQIPTAQADQTIATLAGRQYGVVARRQLLAAGLTSTMLHRRLGTGRLVQLDRGVYAVGHRRLTREGFWLAAVLAVGPGAVLSHRHAAALHGFGPLSAARIDVSTTADRRGQGSIRVHGRTVLTAEDLATVRGIPVTSVARSLVDLAARLPQHRLEKLVSESERQGSFDLRSVERAMRRTRGRHGPGHAAIKRAIATVAQHGPTLTRSELEDRFLALLDAHGLPRPRFNAPVGPYEVDALWTTDRLAVELDGYAHHGSRKAFQDDRTKANDLVAAGYQVVRFTYDDVTIRAAETAARIAAQLSPVRESAPPPRRSARPAR